MLREKISVRFIRLVEQNKFLRILQKLFDFRVVFRFNLLIVDEILLLAFMLHKLETMAVDIVSILVSGNVMDDNFLGDVRA